MSQVPSARWGHSAVLSSGLGLMLGGMDSADTLLSEAWSMQSGCGGSLTLSGSHGSFSDGDGQYSHYQDCRWVITPGLANAVVMLTVSELELLDDNDRIFVHDGDALTAQLLAQYTGTTVPRSVLSSGKSMLVRFSTDGAGEVGKGFTASFQAVCDMGYYWDEGSALCAPCHAGYYNPHRNGGACLACPLGTYASAVGQNACTPCPAYATTPTIAALALSQCGCSQGYYGYNNMCVLCPDGAICPGNDQIRARDGWCQEANEDAPVGSLPSFSHCCQPEECPGGASAACDDSVRRVGDTDDACSITVVSFALISCPAAVCSVVYLQHTGRRATPGQGPQREA